MTSALKREHIYTCIYNSRLKNVFFSPRYLINFLLDASLGMLLIYAGVRAVSVVVEWRQWDSLRFGEYGEYNFVSVKAWAPDILLMANRGQ